MEFNLPVINSAGMLLYRYNKKELCYEVMLIQKRITYSFISFVLGQFNIKNKILLKHLFSTMTIHEKLDILSLDFDMLWFKIWLELSSYPHIIDINSGNIDILCKSLDNIKRYKYVKTFIPYVRSNGVRGKLFTKCKNKYEKHFVTDGGCVLRMLMNKTPEVQLAWQLPKGRWECNETILNTAVRELKEETDINIDDCKIHTNIKPFVLTNIYNKKKYINNYFTAKYYGDKDHNITISNQVQLNECVSVKWCSLEHMRHINLDKNLLVSISKIIKLIKTKKYKI